MNAIVFFFPCCPDNDLEYVLHAFTFVVVCSVTATPCFVICNIFWKRNCALNDAIKSQIKYQYYMRHFRVSHFFASFCALSVMASVFPHLPCSRKTHQPASQSPSSSSARPPQSHHTSPSNSSPPHPLSASPPPATAST